MGARLTNRDYAALAELRFAIRRFLQFSESAARAAGVEPQQHQLLLAVRGLPENSTPTIGALAERLMVKHHSAVELASRCEESGFLRRERGPDDRREVVLKLTPKGERVLASLSLAHREELRAHAPGLSKALAAIVGDGP